MQEPKLRNHFQRLLDEVDKELPSYSTIKKFSLIATPFSEAGGELTPTLKLKRRVVQEKYHGMIEAMFNGKSSAPRGGGVQKRCT